jgi:DNA-binding response OmpR family regulator
MMKKKILYVEDEAHLAKIVRDTLELSGYNVHHLKDGLRVLEAVNEIRPDICVLDVMLPYVDGFTIGSSLRQLYPRLPILYLTAKAQAADVVQGFSSGGTDYLRKPFSMEELMVRIENQLRISDNPREEKQEAKTAVRLGPGSYYPDRMELRKDEIIIRLSHKEAQILSVMIQHQNRALDRGKLLHLVWGDDSFFHSRNLDVYIRKLRQYLADWQGIEVITLKGIGYQFVVPGAGI